MATTAWTIVRPQLDDIEESLTFVAMAHRLRPRLGDIITTWDAGEAIDIARAFMSSRSNQPEGLYSSLLVKLLAVFERYVRGLLEHSLASMEKSTGRYDLVPSTIRHQHTKLSGKALAALDDPRDYISIEPAMIIGNLATCIAGTDPFRFNTTAFCYEITGSGPAVLERALGLIDVNDFWDDIGSVGTIASICGTRGARATGLRAKERLREVTRWRNQIAHGSDAAIALSENQLRDSLAFVRALALAIDAIVEAHYA